MDRDVNDPVHSAVSSHPCYLDSEKSFAHINFFFLGNHLVHRCWTPCNITEPTERRGWHTVLRCIGVDESYAVIFWRIYKSQFLWKFLAVLWHIRWSCCQLLGISFCFRFVSIYRSLSFIYMWTVMVMTLHTLQFNPIINILTQKKFLREYLFFRQGTLSAPLFGLGGAPWPLRVLRKED